MVIVAGGGGGIGGATCRRFGQAGARVGVLDGKLAVIRGVPKPVIARVQGYAIGGGSVLATLCDLTVCSDKAVVGQIGPELGAVDPSFGTACFARPVGEKKAREIWLFCHR